MQTGFTRQRKAPNARPVAENRNTTSQRFGPLFPISSISRPGRLIFSRREPSVPGFTHLKHSMQSELATFFAVLMKVGHGYPLPSLPSFSKLTAPSLENTPRRGPRGQR